MSALLLRHAHERIAHRPTRLPQHAPAWVVREDSFSRRNARAPSSGTQRETAAWVGRRLRWAGDGSHAPREGVVVAVYDDVWAGRERVRVIDVRWDPPPALAARPWGPMSVGIPVDRICSGGWEWVDQRGVREREGRRGKATSPRPDNPAQALCARVGRAVRQFRTRLGHSQETFAATCGVHRTFVGAVERGEVNLTLASLARLARGLGVDVTRLLAEHGDPAPGAAHRATPARPPIALPDREQDV